ncbi:hypothetical protein [Dactylosporangium sp. CA-233914]|uniref:hypothetical protein n=1 Tax=Dactylosporangium sp. CA-233914 TaxID=3239934 RepID=UPI003D8D5D90
MKVRRTVRAAATVAAAALLIACGFTRSPQPQSRPGPQNPAPAPATTSAAPPAPARTTNAVRSGTLSTRTTAGTRDRVSCSDIQTEIRLVASNGPVAWTARVVDRWTSTSVGNPVSSVSVSPSSGTLADGASVVARIRGTYPASKQRFWVLFEYETNAGSPSAVLDVSC